MMLITICNFLKKLKSSVSLWKRHKNTEDQNNAQQQLTKAVLNNPYLQSKALWQDVYGDINERYRRAWFLHLGFVGIIVVLIIGLITLASETKIRSIPFIVQGDEVLTLHHTLDNHNPTLRQQLAPYFAKQFILSARSLSADRQVNQSNQLKAYTFVGNSAVSTLHHFYQQQIKVADQTYVNSIAISSVLSLSAHTLMLHWKEVWRSSNTGELVKTQYYVGEITYAYHSPSDNPLILQSNPMGFYITTFSWSLDSTHSARLGE